MFPLLNLTFLQNLFGAALFLTDIKLMILNAIYNLD